MVKSRFKTKLSKKQKRKDILVFLLVAVSLYAFVIFFGYALGTFDGWTPFEIYTISLAASFFILSMLLFPVLIAAAVLGFQKGKAKRVRDDSTFVPIQNIEYYRDNLNELNPSLVSLLIDLDIYGEKVIVATLLRMKNKNAISFGKDGRIIVTDKGAKGLDASEIELLDLIKSGRLNHKRALLQWKQSRFYDAEKLGYIKKIKVKKEFSGMAVMLGIFSFIAAFFLWGVFLNKNLFATEYVSDVIIAFVILLAADICLFTPFYFLARKAGYYSRADVIWERTPLGNETAEKIAGLGRFINEFSRLSEAHKEELMLWDDYLVYAIVLEENERIVNDISKRYHFNLGRLNKLQLTWR